MGEVRSPRDPTDPVDRDLGTVDEERLSADRAIVLALTADGFTGPRYDLFRHEVMAYGYQVLVGWIRRGVMFNECRSHGLHLAVSPSIRERLSTAFEDAHDLAATTVAQTFPKFVEKGLVEGRWDPGKGASLKSYFIGACVYTFPNVYRTWANGFLAGLREPRYGLLPDQIDTVRGAPDPADVVMSRAAVDDALAALPPVTAHALELIVFGGYPHREAARLAGLTEDALQKRLKRLRFRKRSTGPVEGSDDVA